MNSNYKRLINSTLILSIGIICTKVLTFLLVPFYTRWLTQSDYGIYDLIITYTSLIIPVITLDLGEALFRFTLERLDDEDKVKTVVSTVIKYVIVFYGCGIIIGIPILSRFVDFKLAGMIGVLLFVEIFNNIFMMLMRGQKKLTTYAASSIVFILTTFVLNYIFLKLLNLGLNGIVLAYIIGYSASILFMFFMGKTHRYLSFSSTDTNILKEMLKYSLPLIPNAVAWWIMDASDRTIITTFLGVTTSAILAVAHKVPNICHTMYSVFHLSWQENASDTINLSKEERDNYYNGVLNNMLSILLTIQIVVISCNFLFYKIMVREEYFPGYYQSPILVVALTFSMIAQFIGGIYIATKETKKNGFTTLLSAIINVLLHLVLVKIIGIYAATISTLISYIILLAMRWLDIKKTIDLKVSNKNILYFGVLLYFFASIYFNSFVLNCINLALGCSLFVIVNRAIIKKAFNGALSKLHHK